MFRHLIQPTQRLYPQVIKAMTEINGLYCDIFDRLENTPYENARGDVGTNINKYALTPTMENVKLLVHTPMQFSRPGSYGSKDALFDSYLTEQMYIVTEKKLAFKLYQKVIVKYGDTKTYTTRQFVIYKLETIDSTDIKNPIITYAYLSPLT